MDPERKRLEEKLAFMNVPRKHWDVSMDRIPDKCAYKDKIRRWHELYLEALREGQTPTGLYLHGPVASGKTAIASGILKWAARRRIGGYFLPAVQVVDVAGNNPAVHPSTGEGLWEYVQRVTLLVVDDLLRNHVNNTFGNLMLSRVEELLRNRLAKNVTTVLTGNYDMDFLYKQVPSLASIIDESCYPLYVHGVDYRTYIREHRESL